VIGPKNRTGPAPGGQQVLIATASAAHLNPNADSNPTGPVLTFSVTLRNGVR